LIFLLFEKILVGITKSLFRDPNSPSSIRDLFNSHMGLPTWRRFSLQNQDYLELGRIDREKDEYRLPGLTKI